MTQNLIQKCHICIHKRDIPGDKHIRCSKPDPDMIGSQWAIEQGWWDYPAHFDPQWNLRRCAHFEDIADKDKQ